MYIYIYIRNISLYTTYTSRMPLNTMLSYMPITVLYINAIH